MGSEFGIAVGAKISEYLVKPILRPLHPIFCFQSIVVDFEGQKNTFQSIQDRVNDEIARGNNNADVISISVQRWLDKVKEAMPEVELVEKEWRNKGCFPCNWCPNWTCHYNFSKQVSELTATMKTLCEEASLFGEVGHPPILHQDFTRLPSYAAFIHISSSQSYFNQIVAALERDDVNFIGIYGKAGTGKTGLAEQVAYRAQNLRQGNEGIFNHVILVHLSQNLSARDIQGVIADRLNLSLQHLETGEARADTLHLRLKNGGKILIILDDVRKDFDLGAVGILPGDCKVLLTADAKIHVPNSMHTQMQVELETLSEEEAWTLFKSIIGAGDEIKTNDVAKDALAECYGLPKAVVAMGTTINGKSVSDWGETLQQFKTTKLKIIDSLKDDAKNLKLRQERVNKDIGNAKKKKVPTATLR